MGSANDKMYDSENLSRSGNTEEQQWISYFKQYQNVNELTRKLDVALIDSVLVYEGKCLHIQFKFQVEYDSARLLVDNITELPVQNGTASVKRVR